MRVVLDLCDRCRAEMPLETADAGRLRLRVELPTPRKALRRAPEAPLMELCQACRGEFGAWLREAGAIVAGLTPEPAPAKAPMPPVELPSADPPPPLEEALEGDEEEDEEDPETVVLSVGGAPPPGSRPPPRRGRSK